MTRGRIASALLLFALAAAPLQARPDVPARSAAVVVDAADVISSEKERFLADGLLGFEQTQKRRVAVVTVPDLQGHDIADYGSELGRVWGLRDGSNGDGAVLIVAPNERKVHIEVGSAAKPDLPEEVAQEIVETWVVPSFQQGDFDNGILNGAGAILIHLELPPEQAAAIAERARLEQAEAREADGFPWRALGGLILLFVLWWMVRNAFGVLGWFAGTVALLGSGGGRFGGFGGGGGGFNGGGAGGRW